MNILGIWDGHDSGAALVSDGALVAAINEERLSRRKLEVCFPRAAIAECLAAGGVRLQQIDAVAISTRDPAKALARVAPWTKERYYQVRRRKTAPGPLATLTHSSKRLITRLRPNLLSAAVSRWTLARELRLTGIGSARLHLVDHHESHALCAAYASRFPSAAVLTIDGVGDGLSATTSVFRDGRLTRLRASPASDSLGGFFECVTALLNMRELEDEGKVMALADYATPVPDEENPLLPLLTVDDGRVRCALRPAALERRLRRIHWRSSNEQFAYMAQRTVERVCVDLARDATARTGESNVAIAGGVASNIKATRSIRHLPGVHALHVFPHMGDGGLAVGAALACAHAAGRSLTLDLSRLDLGPAYGEAACESALAAAGLRALQPECLAGAVADLIAADDVVMWFEGRMEYGPRALGHRSVLARPDRIALRDRLNRVLKRRAWYQPFCPSMLRQDAELLLEDWDGGLNPHMTTAYMTRPRCRERIAAVIGTDGTCRPHIVDGSNEPFAALLGHVRARIGLGVVLNTSFNIHGEPLVCSPPDAVDVFLRSGADALALGRFLVVRDAGGH